MGLWVQRAVHRPEEEESLVMGLWGVAAGIVAVVMWRLRAQQAEREALVPGLWCVAAAIVVVVVVVVM